MNNAVLSIADGEVLAAELPCAKPKLAQARIEIHRDDRAADWLRVERDGLND